LRRRHLVRSQLVAVFLIVSSILGIANLMVSPVFSQNSLTMTNISSRAGYNETLTIVQTYRTTGFTTSSSMFTQVMVVFVTSTTFFTYVQITFTSATSTIMYPAPPIKPKPSWRPLEVELLSVPIPSRLSTFMIVRRTDPSHQHSQPYPVEYRLAVRLIRQ